MEIYISRNRTWDLQITHIFVRCRALIHCAKVTDAPDSSVLRNLSVQRSPGFCDSARVKSWDELEQRWSKTERNNLRMGCRLQNRGAMEWEQTACRLTSPRWERGGACSGWDSRTWGVFGSWNEGPSKVWAWWRLNGWWVVRPWCR